MFLPVTNKDFEKLAEQVVSEFFNNNTPLEDGVVKLADMEQLNPEEVKRLVEASNTIATVKLLKSSRDKTAEIILADYTDVVKKTHPTDTPVEKQAMENPTIRFNNSRGKVEVKFPTLQKVASQPIRNVINIFKLKKDVEELTRKKVASELRAYDTFDYLVSEFSKRNSPDFNKFACEVYSIYGDKVKGIITELSKALVETTTLEKVAYIIDNRNSIINKFANLVTHLTDISTLNTKLNSSKQALSTEWQKAKNK